MWRSLLAAILGVAVLVGCSGSEELSREEIEAIDEPPVDVDPTDPPAYVDDVLAAIDAVEVELGGAQEFFEVTANSQFTNVFVALDDATSALPYLFVDGELQPPAPVVDGATGEIFTRSDVDFDPDRIVGIAQAQLPEASVDSLSVYGSPIGATYVLGATSGVGGILDIVVGADGTVFSVDPV
ncbi:MAG: hypothetical protein AB8G26_09325 [Ilumatobacter sp.]